MVKKLLYASLPPAGHFDYLLLHAEVTPSGKFRSVHRSVPGRLWCLEVTIGNIEKLEKITSKFVYKLNSNLHVSRIACEVNLNLLRK